MEGEVSSQASRDEGHRKRTVKMAAHVASLATTLNVQAKKLRLFLTALLRPARGFPFAMPLVWPLPFMIEPADSAMVDRSTRCGQDG